MTKRRTLTDQQRGVLLAAGGVTILSFDALLVRLSDAAIMDIMFWRGWLVAFSLLAFLTLSKQLGQYREVRAAFGISLGIAVLYAFSSSMFVVAVQLTHVANAVLILSCTPFCAAIFSRLLLAERLQRRTLITMVVAFCGVILVFSSAGGMQGGSNDLLGNLAASAVALATGLSLTLLRRRPHLPRIPVLAASAMLVGLVALPFASPLAPSPAGLGWLAVMGLVQIPLAWGAALTATRYISAPEVSLFLIIETVLGPIWVWMILGEVIPPMTLLGGAVIMTAVVSDALIGVKMHGRRPVTNAFG